MHRGILEPLADLVALGPGEVDLDLVSMPGAQLDAGIAELLEPGKNRGEIPVLGDVVGDDTELGYESSILDRLERSFGPQ